MFTLLSSGSNAHGQLSNGSLEDYHDFSPCSFFRCPPRTMPSNTKRVLNLTSGANHTIVLLETCSSDATHGTQMWGCGDGSAGQLGPEYRQVIRDGAPTTIFRPINLPLEQSGLSGYRIKLVTASWETTYAVLSCEGKGDVLISMGMDDFGDLGIGGKGKGKRKETAEAFHIISFAHLSVDGTPLSNATIAVQLIASGQHHVVAQLQATWSNQDTKTCIVGWGASRHGQLGNMLGVNGRLVPYLSTPKIIPSGDSSDSIDAIALGNHHTVLLRVSGKASCLGSNRRGQLQGIEGAPRVTHLGCTWNGTYIVVTDDEGTSRILSTGSGAHGQLGRSISSLASDELPSLAPVQLGVLSNSIDISAIACGTEHVLALLSDGPTPGTSSEVWGWGWNEHGNLGIGTTKDAFIPVKVWPPASIDGVECSRTAIGIWAGCGTSWILTS